MSAVSPFCGTCCPSVHESKNGRVHDPQNGIVYTIEDWEKLTHGERITEQEFDKL